MAAEVRSFDNPRIEMEEHYYNPVLTKLPALGLKAHYLEDILIESMLDIIELYKDQVRMETIRMKVLWKQTHQKDCSTGHVAPKSVPVIN